jgi:hypothetical protein
VSPQEKLLKEYAEIRTMPDGPQKADRMKQFRESVNIDDFNQQWSVDQLIEMVHVLWLKGQRS